MKKLPILLFIFGLILSGCNIKNEELKKKDYSEYSFVDVKWTRETEYDIEFISFYSNGDFTYSCGCGNPVNNSDVCETYSYNDETKEIKLECDEPSNYTITTIRMISYDENSLVLDFNGDIRKFEKD